ncbi:MAG: hypothetical protein GYB64_12950 [Chloroflexi bacterium]|nr:hypothetical protein [Chloroflexota bacterium]
MTLPEFYDPTRAGTVFTPDTPAILDAAFEADLPPAESDEFKTLVLLVDMQVDFVHPQGSLSVPGAVDDTRRTVEWIYRNAGLITTVVASLDSHLPNQIFYPAWWIGDDGEHPEPYTLIHAEDIEARKWQPTRDEDWSTAYVRKLEEQAKKVLTIWPYHCMIGTLGHRIMPTVYEAISYLAAGRQTNPTYLIKGRIPRSEHYSLFEPEIHVAEAENGGLRMDLIELIAQHDRIYIAGQAKSHCVLESTRSLFAYFGEHNPDMLDRFHLLTDCTSAVDHPEIDFDAYAEEELDDLRARGLKDAISADPVEI